MPPPLRGAGNAPRAPTSKLLALPSEIKVIIWGYAMPAERKITYGNNSSCAIRPHHLFNRVSDTKRRTRQGFLGKDGLNLLLTCRQVRSEAEHILYSGTTFVFFSAQAVVAFLFAAKANANLIRSVDIKLSASAQETDYYVNHNRLQDVRAMALAAERFTGVRQLKISFLVNQWGFQNFNEDKWSQLAQHLGHKMVIRPLTNLPSLNKVSVTFDGQYSAGLLPRIGPGDPLARAIQGFEGKSLALAEDAKKMFTLQPPGQVRQVETTDADGEEDPAEWDGQCLTYLGAKWGTGLDGRVIVKTPTTLYKPDKKGKKARRALHQRYRAAAHSDPADDGEA